MGVCVRLEPSIDFFTLSCICLIDCRLPVRPHLLVETWENERREREQRKEILKMVFLWKATLIVGR